jgi:hypothetical protein
VRDEQRAVERFTPGEEGSLSRSENVEVVAGRVMGPAGEMPSVTIGDTSTEFFESVSDIDCLVLSSGVWAVVLRRLTVPCQVWSGCGLLRGVLWCVNDYRWSFRVDGV